MNNPTAEQGLIGCLLIEPVVCHQQAINAGVNESWFTTEYCQKAWKIITAMDKRLVNAQMVLEESRKRKDELPIEFLGECMDKSPDINHISQWIAELRQCLIRRSIKRASMRMAIEADDAEKDPEQLLAETQSRLHSTITEIDSQPDPQEVYREVIAGWVRAKEGGTAGLRTPWGRLNELIGGFRPGKVYIIASRPGGGKSTMAVNIADHLSSNGNMVSIASLEMGESELRGRMLATAANYSSYGLDTGFYDHVQIENLKPIAEQQAKYPLHINDSVMNIDKLCAWAQYEIIKYESRLIIIDYLQLIASAKRYESRNVEISAFMNRLCDVAKTMNVPLILLSQLSRSSSHEERTPELHDLRDSGSIEQGAYAVIFIHHSRDENNNTETSEFIVAKNRGGPTGSKPVTFERNRQRFIE